MRSFIRATILVGASVLAIGAAGAGETKTAIFSGGCFWCMEYHFDQVDGVLDTTSGYTGGHLANPTYQDVITETTGHREAEKVTYDPSVVSYAQLLNAYWHSIDPTDATGQACNRGESYTSAIWVGNEEEREAAEASKLAVKNDLAIDKAIVTPILDATTFYPAEEYHQDYYQKNPVAFDFYRNGCGGEARVEQVWGAKAFLGLDRRVSP